MDWEFELEKCFEKFVLVENFFDFECEDYALKFFVNQLDSFILGQGSEPLLQLFPLLLSQIRVVDNNLFGEGAELMIVKSVLLLHLVCVVLFSG